jgi:hypothetical protein
MDINDINNGAQEPESFELPKYVEWEEKEGKTIFISRIEANNRIHQQIIGKLPFEPFELVGQTILIKIREQLQRTDEKKFYIDAQWVYAQVLNISVSLNHDLCGVEIALGGTVHLEVSLAKLSESEEGGFLIGSTDTQATIVWFGVSFDSSEDNPDPEWIVQIVSSTHGMLFWN